MDLCSQRHMIMIAKRKKSYLAFKYTQSTELFVHNILCRRCAGESQVRQTEQISSVEVVNRGVRQLTGDEGSYLPKGKLLCL